MSFNFNFEKISSIVLVFPKLLAGRSDCKNKNFIKISSALMYVSEVLLKKTLGKISDRKNCVATITVSKGFSAGSVCRK